MSEVVTHKLAPLEGGTVGSLVDAGARLLDAAGVSFGHGTTNAQDEAAWLVLWRLGLPLDTPLDDGPQIPKQNQPVTPANKALVATLFEERITTRKPAAYLTQEAWLQGVPFYVDERAIVPRSLIAELIAEGGVDDFSERAHAPCARPVHRQWQPGRAGGHGVARRRRHGCRHLLRCAGRGTHQCRSKHGLQDRIALVQSDGLAAVPGPWDLVLCNPPYVNAQSMQASAA